MNTDLNSSGARGISGEGWAALAGVVGSAVLLLKKLLRAKGEKPEAVGRAEFFAEALAVRERMNTMHLALLEKLEANHRELLGALGRQSERIGALETAIARLEALSASWDVGTSSKRQHPSSR